MNLHSPDDRSDALSFQLAPMIDIVFVVLVFFIATYAVSRDEKLLGLDLPVAEKGQPEYHQRQQLLVNLNAQGEIFVESIPLSPASLERRLTQLVAFATPAGKPMVIIRADGGCPHREVVKVLDLCARAGIDSVNFSARSQ
ncbi:hypothetical protein FACS1894139_06610 [Planctomycetales bacterium]|nr:hypothetical protein FACS1894107_03940 [Planctomycetales bacterium]GHT04449.1 hypothetical protein FACS1894139_06610 [Planctomycetales bacterium]GHV23919.1 hypothetical protein AGMMS49959_18720 [Planctomycetales bacterium]